MSCRKPNINNTVAVPYLVGYVVYSKQMTGHRVNGGNAVQVRPCVVLTCTTITVLLYRSVILFIFLLLQVNLATVYQGTSEPLKHYNYIFTSHKSE